MKSIFLDPKLLVVSDFDQLCEALLGTSEPACVVGHDECFTDRYLQADPEVQDLARELSTQCHRYLLDRFKAFLEEAIGPVSRNMLSMDGASKSEMLILFQGHYMTAALDTFLRRNDPAFRPIFLTGWCDGIATMQIQSEAALCAELYGMLEEEFFEASETTTGAFLELDFQDKLKFYRHHENRFQMAIVALDTSHPGLRMDVLAETE